MARRPARRPPPTGRPAGRQRGPGMGPRPTGSTQQQQPTTTTTGLDKKEPANERARYSAAHWRQLAAHGHPRPAGSIICGQPREKSAQSFDMIPNRINKTKHPAEPPAGPGGAKGNKYLKSVRASRIEWLSVVGLSVGCADDTLPPRPAPLIHWSQMFVHPN